FEKDGQRLVLVSNQGDILYDPGEMWTTIQDGQLKEDGLLKLQTDDGTYYASVRELDELGWKIAVYIPEGGVLAPLKTYDRSILVSWIVAIIVLLTTLSFVLHYLLKDIPFIV